MGDKNFSDIGGISTIIDLRADGLVPMAVPLSYGIPIRRGPLKSIAAIEDPHVIAKILTHLSLSARAPPRSPARPFDRLRMA